MGVVTQSSFVGGEITQRLSARDDVGRYSNSVSIMRNMLPFAQGPATRRPPTRFVAGTRDNAVVRLVPFIFGREDAYVLEFGDEYVRVFRARGVVTLSDATFEFTSPYTAAQLDELDWAQTADTLYIVHPDLNMRRLTRSSNTDWTFAETSVGGARSVTFYQQRLVLAGRSGDQTLTFSQVNSFEAVTGGSGATAAFNYTLASGRVNTIVWATPSRDTLLLGTQGGVWAVAAPNQSEGFSSSNIEARQQSQIGCHARPPAVIDQDVFFITRSQTQLRAATFDFGVDGYATPDQAVFAEHLAKRGMKELAYQADPDSVLFMPALDGSLITATVQRTQEVNAWARHTIAGKLDNENARVESIAVIPSPFGDVDDVWLVVARTINEQTVRHVEYLADPYRPSTPIDRDNGAFLDSQLSVTLLASATFTLTQAAETWRQGETATLTTSVGVFSNPGERFMLRSRTRGGDLQRCIVTVEAVLTATTATVLLVTDAPSLLQGIAAQEVYEEIQAVSGLGHLEGETVGVMVDGATHPNRQVVGGGFELQAPAFEVVAGLLYTSEIFTLDFNLPTDGDQQDGKAARKRISRVSVDFQDSLFAEIGVQGEEPETLFARETDDPQDVAPALVSGVLRVTPANASAIQRRVGVRQRTALPMTVRAITIEQTSSL